ncbi:hypothetical protein L7F22_025089 [Adiantum nelumboides]|nr:hypothetical protein [Adiantum nelumboides]
MHASKDLTVVEELVLSTFANFFSRQDILSDGTQALMGAAKSNFRDCRLSLPVDNKSGGMETESRPQSGWNLLVTSLPDCVPAYSSEALMPLLSHRFLEMDFSVDTMPILCKKLLYLCGTPCCTPPYDDLFHHLSAFDELSHAKMTASAILQ